MARVSSPLYVHDADDHDGDVHDNDQRDPDDDDDRDACNEKQRASRPLVDQPRNDRGLLHAGCVTRCVHVCVDVNFAQEHNA